MSTGKGQLAIVTVEISGFGSSLCKYPDCCLCRDYSHPNGFYPATRKTVNYFVHLLYAAMFPEEHASRVLTMASSPSQSFFCALTSESLVMHSKSSFRRDAETSTFARRIDPADETRALLDH